VEALVARGDTCLVDGVGGTIAARAAVTGFLFTDRFGVERTQRSGSGRVQLTVMVGVLRSVTGAAGKLGAAVVKVGKGRVTLGSGVAAVDGTRAVGLVGSTTSRTIGESSIEVEATAPTEPIWTPGFTSVLQLDSEPGAIEILDRDLERLQELDRDIAGVPTVKSPGGLEFVGEGTSDAGAVEVVATHTDIRDVEATINAFLNLQIVGRASGSTAVSNWAPENLVMAETIILVRLGASVSQDRLDDVDWMRHGSATG
jgi:hypothetical protein